MTLKNDIDMQAIQMATEAKNELSAHEQVCAERYSHIIDTANEAKLRIESLYTRFWVVACSLVGLLLTIIILLLENGAAHHG